MSAKIDHLAVTCSVEPAPPLDRPRDAEPTEKGFTLLLSASLVAGEEGPEFADEHRKLFHTWRAIGGEPWEITGVKAWAWRPEGEGGHWEEVEVIDPQGFRTGLPEVLREDLEGRISRLAEERFVWDPAAAAADPEEDEDEAPDQPHVRHLLASLSTETTPLPGWLNLAWRFRVEEGDLGENPDAAVLLAVPVFARREVEGEPAPPDGSDPNPEEGHLHRVAYAPEAEGAIPWRAYVYPRRVRPARDLTDNGYIDFNTGWLRSTATTGGSAPWSGEDWLRKLEAGLPDLFDLAQRLTDLVREHRDELGERREAFLIALRQAVVAAVRDQAGVGIETAADGGSLLDWAVAEDEELTAAREGIAAALQRFETGITLTAWRDLLLAVVPELAEVAAVTDREDAARPRSVAELERELAELETLTGRLADPDTLLAVVRRQWREATAGNADLPRWPRLDAALTRVAGEQPLRPLLARPRVRGVLRRLMRDLHGAARLDEALKNLLGEELSCAAAARWDLPVGTGCTERQDFAGLKPRVDRTLDLPEGLLERALSKAADRFVRSLPLPRAEDDAEEAAEYDPGPGEPTEVPHPVVLPVARPAALEEGDDAPAPAADGDTLRRIQGYAVLLRKLGEDDTGTWRCLNMARLASPGDPEKNLCEGALCATALVPYRLAYRDGVKELALTYDNHPLVARSPAERLARGEKERGLDLMRDSGERLAEEDPQIEPLVLFEPVKLPGDDALAAWARLPGLAFGDRYETLISTVLNGGVLATGLGFAADPTVPVPPASFPDGAADLDLEPYLRKIRYLRRVPVGPPRVPARQPPAPEEGVSVGVPPPIPEGVAPLAREIEVPPLPPPGDGEAADEERPREPELPVILLTPAGWRQPGHHTYRTDLLPPSTDLYTWDRWRGAEIDLEERAGVWAHFFEHADPEERGVEANADLEIDDPAVERFYVEALRRWPASPPREEPPRWLELPRRTNTPTPWQRQAAPHRAIQVTVRHAAAVRLKVEDDVIELDVPAGEVWELRISAEVSAQAAKRFHPDLPRHLHWRPEDQEGSYLASPLRLLVEAAALPVWADDTKAPVAAEALLRSLTPATVGERLVVRLDRTAAATKPDGTLLISGEVLQDVSRVELRRQLWRWDGRLHDAFPFATDPAELPPPANLLAWEATAFAERPDDDHLRHPRVVRLREDHPVLLEEDRSGDPRAVLYRFGLRVFSRYRGLVPAEHESLEAAAPLVENEEGLLTPWRRHLERCRHRGPVPKPRVKLVVPLTAADEGDESEGQDDGGAGAASRSAQGAAGLLVVLDQPWYDTGGLAEELEVELMTVKDPAAGDLERPELGPDPILTGRGWPLAGWPGEGDESRSASAAVTFQPRGPVGHTFDTDSSAPLFVATSFYLPPPELPEAAPEAAAEPDLSWTFAKLRFRRVLRQEGMVAAVAGEGETSDDPSSEPTDPHWVQLLPAADAYHLETATAAAGNGAAAGLELRWREFLIDAVDGGFEVLHGTSRRPLAKIESRVEQDDNSTMHHQQLLLVTRLIHDVRGREDEKYLGLYRLEATGNGDTAPVWHGADQASRDAQSKIQKTWRLQARLVEVQSRRTATAADEGADSLGGQETGPGSAADAAGFWPGLFGGETGEDGDVARRLVRVSPPIGPVVRRPQAGPPAGRSRGPTDLAAAVPERARGLRTPTPVTGAPAAGAPATGAPPTVVPATVALPTVAPATVGLPTVAPADPLPLSASVGRGGVNRPADVRAVQERLRRLGFAWVPADGQADAETVRTLRLFQAIKNGLQRVDLAANDGLVEPGRDTHLWLQAANAPRWLKLPERGTGFVNWTVRDPADDHDWATRWMDDTIRAAGERYEAGHRRGNAGIAEIGVRHASLPRGGDTPAHGGHETGLNTDLRLPRTDGGVGGITHQDARYDRAAMRAMLRVFRAQPLVAAVLFNDPVLVSEGLCSRATGHDDHAHLNLRPPPRA